MVGPARIRNAQSAQVEEMFAQHLPVGVDRRQLHPSGFLVVDQGDLDDRRPAAQNRATQPQQQMIAGDGNAFDVETVVLSRNRQKGAEMRIFLEPRGELVAMRIAAQHGCRAQLALVAGLLEQHVLAILFGDRDAGQQEAVALRAYRAQALVRLLHPVVRLGLLAPQAMRACQPQILAVVRQAFDVGLVDVVQRLAVRRQRQRQERMKRELLVAARETAPAGAVLF